MDLTQVIFNFFLSFISNNLDESFIFYIFNDCWDPGYTFIQFIHILLKFRHRHLVKIQKICDYNTASLVNITPFWTIETV